MMHSSGMTGDVCLATHRTSGRAFVVKSLELGSAERSVEIGLRNEIAALRTLDHPNIVRIYEWFETPTHLHLILEHCSGGELFDFIKAQPQTRFRERVAAALVAQITSAVAHCHSLGIAHRDLKLENVLLESPARSGTEALPTLKLIDFGLSRSFRPGAATTSMISTVGTIRYIAPEVLIARERKATYSEKCDSWSIGVMAYMLLSGRAPFKGRDDRAILESVKRGKYTMATRQWDGVSETAKDFIRRCLRYNPTRRASAHELLNGAC